MKQLTVRGFDQETLQALETLAKAEGISLSQAALKLMRRGANLRSLGRKRIGDGLDRFIGSLDEAEEQTILEALEPFQELDSGFWNEASS